MNSDDDAQYFFKPFAHSLNGIQKALIEHHGTSLSWAKTAAFFGISKGTAWRIGTQKYEPKSPEIRKQLGLPEIITVRVYRDPETGRYCKEVKAGGER
jgi:hypothetical protein